MPLDAQHPNRRVVAVAAVLDPDDQLLMVRTRRLPDHWQPVGGGQSAQDPSPRATVVREVGEELGLHLASEAFIDQFQAPYDFGDGVVHFYTVRLPASAILAVDQREILEHRWVSLEDAQLLNAYPATRQFLQHLAAQWPLAPRPPHRSLSTYPTSPACS